jgi:predicted small metal-binding protein
MGRVMADCRRFPSDSKCSLTIIGEEEEVVRAAAEHAASVHGHEDTPEMRQKLREFLEPADAYSTEPRAQEAMPSSSISGSGSFR